MMSRYGVKVLWNPAYHPQVNPTERVNRVLKTMLESYTESDHRRWADNLSKIGGAVRTAKHDATGITPYFANFGRKMKLNGADYKPVNEEEPIKFDRSKDLDKRASDLQALHLDVHEDDRTSTTWEIWFGEKILTFQTPFLSAKLALKYLGPFRVTQKLSRLVYKLDDGGNVSWHIKDLKDHPG